MAQAVQYLKNGGVVVFPTETSYAIGCDATNAKAVRRVFQLKGRPAGKGTPLIVSSLAMAKRYGQFSKTAMVLAKKHWPGALTLVVPVFARSKATLRYRSGQAPQSNERLLRFARKDIAKEVLQENTVAIRISSHHIARALARGLGLPIVATSANASGEPPAFRITSDFLPSLTQGKGRGKVFILDVGSLKKNKPSTLIRVVGSEVEVLRQGPIRVRSVTR